MSDDLNAASRQLFDALLRTAEEHEVIDVVKASVNLLAVAIGEYAIERKWDETQALKMAEETGGELVRFVKTNWGHVPSPLPPRKAQ